jgi:hypothetical protein
MAKKYLMVITHSDDNQERAKVLSAWLSRFSAKGLTWLSFLFLKARKWPV